MQLHKPEILVPVVGLRSVAAFVHVVADGVEHGLAGGRHGVPLDAWPAKQLVDRRRSAGRQKLAHRVGPLVGGARLQQHGPGRKERNQHVGIHGI